MFYYCYFSLIKNEQEISSNNKVTTMYKMKRQNIKFSFEF